MGSLRACLPLLLVLMATTGCESIFNQSDGAAATSAHPGADAARGGSSDEDRREVAAYLDFMDVLDSSDEKGWHAIFEHTLNAFQEDPTRERRVRFALVMSRADTKSTEPKVTRNMLADSRKLLDETVHDPAPTPPLVRKFAHMMLTEVDTRLALYDELRSLRSQLAKAHQASQTAHRDRSEAEMRMRRIDAALAEANAKLEAVMKIERNIGPTGKETFP
jgi:hypothetical protein